MAAGMTRAFAVGIVVLLCGFSGLATVITVTGTGDTIAADMVVTLREAITAANTNAASGDAPAGSVGLDTILFAIAGAPGTVHTIGPLGALPTITEPIIIDGYSQSGASENSAQEGTNAVLTIVLDGTFAGSVAGVVITAGNSTIQGLVIQRFANEGILLTTNGNNTIRGNFLGSDEGGTLDRGNGVSGISILSSNNLLGGTSVADRNLISGNDAMGVLVASPASGNAIYNNVIGTDDTALVALANDGPGISITTSVTTTLIGGFLVGTANVIAFNAEEGVVLSSLAGTGNLISRPPA